MWLVEPENNKKMGFHIHPDTGDTNYRNYQENASIVMQGYSTASPTAHVNIALFRADGGVILNHAGDTKFNTADDGIEVTGDIEIPSDGFMYFGDKTTSGSWRMGISGADFIHQKYNGADWVTKQTIVG
jgi:hypothetical protein